MSVIYGNPITLGGGGGEITITSDGNYDVKKYATANVDVVSLGTRSITANGTYDVTKYASANVNVQSAPVLVWTNASPTSNFAAQTVSLPSGYSGFIVEIRRDATYDHRAYGYFPINSSTGGVIHYSGSQYFVREVTNVTSNSIVFARSTLNCIQQNNLAMPTRIWGVKFTL